MQHLFIWQYELFLLCTNKEEKCNNKQHNSSFVTTTNSQKYYFPFLPSCICLQTAKHDYMDHLNSERYETWKTQWKILRNNLDEVVLLISFYFSQGLTCIKGEHDLLHMFSMRTACSTIINLKQALLTLTQRHCWMQDKGIQTGISPCTLISEQAERMIPFHCTNYYRVSVDLRDLSQHFCSATWDVLKVTFLSCAAAS